MNNSEFGLIKVAVDAMGGDYGPEVTVPASIDALIMYPNLHIILVGNETKINKMLAKFTNKILLTIKNRLSIQHTEQVVEMDDKPSTALRNKRDSSMHKVVQLVKYNEANACVSAGNTGALMAIARFVLKMLAGISRPAIVYSIPTMNEKPVHVLDLGANVDCSPTDLYQFAVMGELLARSIGTSKRPRVALLNIGSEAIKGSELVKKADELLAMDKRLNYVGYIEGDEIFKGTVDVVVCDGFVGNVALKTSEGMTKLVLNFMKEEFSRSLYNKFIAVLAKPALSALSRRLDPKNYNGASLLGLQGVVIKSHGSAKRDAFTTAIKMAMIEANKSLPDYIKQHIQEINI